MVLLYVGTYTQKLSFVHGKGKGIHSFHFDEATGALKPHGVTQDIGVNVSYITGTKSTIYAVNEAEEPQENDPHKLTGYVRALKIEADGSLTPLNRFESRGGAPCHLALSPGDKFLSVANYSGGNLSLFPIDQADGSLKPATSFYQASGASMANPDRQEAPHVHSTTWITAPTTGVVTLAAADLGNDRVIQLALDADKQTVTLLDNAPPTHRPAGSGPRHLALHPTLPVAYVVDELSSTVGVHPINESNALVPQDIQTISMLPADFKEFNLAADVHVTPNGRFLYAANRGHNSLACYRILVEDGGKLELLGYESTRGTFPRNFLIHGDWLLAANQDSDSIQVFKIDATTGQLTFTGHSVDCPTPVCLFLHQA
ncbi:hypothetical protein Poli38472_010573 [Pythium oligandrum]|uniref:6-phosphogluconolactonase n=1 Tax=Pythium oligandrum TaxID=41045 RepID=A0A8K1C3C1_PYTOL|nr:hypothetical protein Poli38472_010573 [Pythium oligandrum]|eukprot:TMW55691.1 hypothetical protein Poli38472_010573 [Pythium oligandrum]